MKLPSRIQLAHLPTPVSKLERLTERLGGPEIFIKRDDFTGAEISGNKVRKLEFAVAEALERNCNILITCGGLQSNHARATAAAAAKLGISSCLVLRGKPEEMPDGNYLLDLLLGAKIKFVTPEEYRYQMPAIFEETKKELESQGFRPYIIPEGASNGIGTFGYVKAMKEIAQQEKELGLTFNKVVVAVGSGGTYGGLLLGSKLWQEEKEIYGINVCDDAEYFKNRIFKTLAEAEVYLEEKINVKKEDIRILDGYVGPGYGMSTPEQLETIKLVAKTEGVVLDPVYTGKAMHGLIEEIKKGEHFRKGDRVLFVHTGGHFGLFPVRGKFFQ